MDDREALRYARRQGIPAYETLDLMSMAVSDGDIDGAAAFVLMEQMTSRGRSAPARRTGIVPQVAAQVRKFQAK